MPYQSPPTKTKDELTARKAQFAAAMLAARTKAEAARRAGISERTARTYLKDPRVQAAIGRGLDDVLAEATRHVIGAAAQAIATLEEIHKDPAAPPLARIAAARLILDAVPRYRQTLDLATRVTNLEDLQASLEHGPDTPYR